MLISGNIIVIALLVYGCWKRVQAETRIFFLPAVIAKIGAGICLGMVYQYYYAAGDSFTLFRQASEQTDVFLRTRCNMRGFSWLPRVMTGKDI